jgi:hypothetical protein
MVSDNVFAVIAEFTETAHKERVREFKPYRYSVNLYLQTSGSKAGVTLHHSYGTIMGLLLGISKYCR